MALNEQIYIMVKPSDFERFSEIDSEGDIKSEYVPDFNLLSVDLNFLLFELKTNADHTEFDTVATELVSGLNFDFIMGKQNGESLFFLENEPRGLKFHKYLPFSKSIVEPILAAGRMTNINNCEPVKLIYLSAVKEMLDTALKRKLTYLVAKEEGPDSNVVRSLRETYNNLKKENVN